MVGAAVVTDAVVVVVVVVKMEMEMEDRPVNRGGWRTKGFGKRK